MGRIVFAYILLCLLPLATHAKNEQSLKDFENEAYALRMELVHNHTFDQANIPKADSLYKESVERGSLHGKMYALQIKYYAVANSGNDSLFHATIDEYIKLAKDMEYFEEYFDGTSTKIQYEMSSGNYSRCMFMAHDMLKMAEKEKSNLGMYESNLLLGQIFKYRSSYSSALRYFKNGLKYVDEADSIPHFTLYREMAECYGGCMQYDKALKYARMANEWACFDIYRLYGEWTYLNELFQAKDVAGFRKALKESMLNDSDNYQSLPRDMQISLDVMKLTVQNRYAAAREKVMEHDTESRQLGLLILIAQYEGKMDDAVEYLHRLSYVDDSIESELLNSELAELDIRLGKAAAENKAEQERREHQQLLAWCVGSLMMVILVVLVIWNRKNQQQNERLQKAREAEEKKNVELITAQAATEKALMEAENANAMRMHFIQNMTHEIRTPLNAIFGFTQLLTDRSVELDEESEREMSDAIMDSTLKLTSMVDDIIELSNYDSQSVAVSKVATDSRTIIERAVESVANDAAEGVEVRVDVGENYSVMTDVDKMVGVLIQLLSNAYKFTDSGYVSIGATDREREGYLTFYVEDTGKGIPEELREKVFERFFKVDEFVPGTGLGLPLCRAIMTSLNGEIELDERYELGARFLLRIQKA